MGQYLRQMNVRIASALVSLLSIVTTAAWAGEEPWKEVRSPHFRVLTNGSPVEGRKVAHEFEQLRWVFTNRFPGARIESGSPLLIFAARDEETARKLDPTVYKRMGGNMAGEFHHGWEKQFALVRLDTFGGDGAKEVVYHEYTHTILHLNSHWLPAWLDEGMAEFYGYTRFEGHKIYLGAPTVRVRILRGRQPDPIEKIISVNHGSPIYNSEFFYAESWALVHFLIYGPRMDGGKKLDQLFQLLQQRVEQKKAIQQVFGPFGPLDQKLVSYMLQPTFTTTVLKTAPEIDDKVFAVRELSVAETEAELGGFYLGEFNHAAARLQVEQALKDDPKLGLAHELMGFLDFSDGKDGEAATEFAQAFALNGTLYLSLFDKTMLSPMAISNDVGDINAFGRALGNVLQLNPDFAPAYVQLARLALRENDLPSALAVSRRAEDLEPSRAGYHLLTGQILRRMGKGAEAADTAIYVADRWFGPDHDEAVELWNSVPADQRPAGESIREMLPSDTQTAEGSVKSVNCSEQEQGWTFVLNHDGQTLTFHRKGGFISGYSDTLWYGGDHFTLCHHLEGLRAVVRYKKPADPTYAGDVAEIEIRDDPPEPLKGATVSARP
jgi:tetratricopeptide (TPR) repeat protein